MLEKLNIPYKTSLCGKDGSKIREKAINYSIANLSRYLSQPYKLASREKHVFSFLSTRAYFHFCQSFPKLSLLFSSKYNQARDTQKSNGWVVLKKNMLSNIDN